MSARTSTFVAIVDKLERMRSSVNGNPRFRVHLTDGRNFPTVPDAMYAYAAENRELIGVPVIVHLTAGRGKDHWNVSYVAPCPVWLVWHGGANYSPSGTEHAEPYASADTAREVMAARAANRDGTTPCVGDDSEGWIYLSDPRRDDTGDAYPDFTLTRNPDSSHYSRDWKVSPA